MNTLEKIIAHKSRLIEERKEIIPVSALEAYAHFERTPYSFKNAIKKSDKFGIIAEFKRHSPSKGDINSVAMPELITPGYSKAGASALSVLTDKVFFGGSNADLTVARNCNTIPILRKDFTVGEYQVIEAKAIGADAILLIAACLNKTEIFNLAKLAKSIGLNILFEIHAEDELEKLNEFIDVVGVNNRNLKTFEVNIETSMQLAEKIPSDFVKISESGISSINAIKKLREAGYEGFLIGENFMREAQPHKACEKFISELL